MFGDESAFYLLPCVVKTWAKVGQTPVLRATTRREHLSVASAISTDGSLVSMARATAFNGDGVVGFLRHLLGQIEGKIVLIWDGAKIPARQSSSSSDRVRPSVYAWFVFPPTHRT
jgi:hypothetical protein